MHNFDPDLSSQIITEEDRAQIEACLQQLRTDTGAGYSMVLDRAGQIIAWESSAERREMVYLGALLAATYASTREIARILHEDGFRTLLQEGLREKVFTETIDDHWLLVVIFDRYTNLGLIKVLARRAAGILAKIAYVVEQRGRDAALPRIHQIGRATIDTIDLIFDDDGSDET